MARKLSSAFKSRRMKSWLELICFCFFHFHTAICFPGLDLFPDLFLKNGDYKRDVGDC